MFFLKALTHLAALFRVELSEASMRAYLIELKILDAAMLMIDANNQACWETALRLIIRECRFFPTIFDFSERLPQPCKPSL